MARNMPMTAQKTISDTTRGLASDTNWLTALLPRTEVFMRERSRVSDARQQNTQPAHSATTAAAVRLGLTPMDPHQNQAHLATEGRGL